MRFLGSISNMVATSYVRVLNKNELKLKYKIPYFICTGPIFTCSVITWPSGHILDGTKNIFIMGWTVG
jgi:hypothetical protein